MARKKQRLSQRLEAATRSRDEPAPVPFEPFEEPEPLVEFAAFVGAAIVGLLVIMAFAVFYGTGSIESKLEAQTTGLLRGNGIRDVDVDASGLELTLTGTVREEGHVALALAIAHSIEGVRDVDAQNVIYVPPPEDVEFDIEADPLVFSWDATGGAVTGTVSDEATRSVVVEAVRETWADVDASGLVVKDGIDPERDWLPSILRVVVRAGEDLPEGTVIANAGSSFVLVTGELETRSEQIAVRRDVEDILSALTFEFTNGLTIKQAPPPVTNTPSASSPSTAAPTTTTLAPEVIELQETLDELIEGKIVEFGFASAVITAEGRRLLDEVLDALRKFPDVPVEIGGHTDDVGSEESNLLLSRLRAAAVLSYLIDNGESASRFVVIGYGESLPVADNSTAQGRARNRRIEFTALSE
jgi:outer membrane protein OmpA-like peptidoglycan-associated protein